MYQKLLLTLFVVCFAGQSSFAQPLATQLQIALDKLTKDDQFKHSVISLYIINSKTGDKVFDANSEAGMAPASCQKVITSISAFELLGKAYQYKTHIGFDHEIRNGVLEGKIHITGAGDPTLGSNRWASTNNTVVFKKILSILQRNKIRSVTGGLVVDDAGFTNQQVPNGWIWEDIGNYYGAGAWGLNWRENQYDLTFKTGSRVGEPTTISTANPPGMMTEYTFINLVKTGKKGSGDNAYLFAAPFQQQIFARGTVPLSDNGFTISGSIPDPPSMFIKNLQSYLAENGINIAGTTSTNSIAVAGNIAGVGKIQPLDSLLSPSFDSINYWFLKKSVNLFGEALIKTIAFERSGLGSTDSGIAIIQNFWAQKGVEKAALKMMDGSGLAPANRVTTRALVTVMQYAIQRPWFESFFHALPEINGIKMKDGYIGGVRSYTGYIKAGNGIQYTFAFIANNFDGNAGAAREKMWKVLDLLK